MGLTLSTTNRTAMSEPTTAAGSIAGYKLALFVLPFIGTLIAFCLGVRFAPLSADDPHKDVLNRLTACFVSAFVLGTGALVLLMQHAPGAFVAANAVAIAAGLPAIAGFFALSLCVFILCSIPGPWLWAAVFLWLQRRKGKDIAEIAHEVRAEVGGLVGGTTTGGTQ